MKIKKIFIENYRGIALGQEIPLSNLSSIVGKNDSGKSIILNAIASFLDSKNYPVTESDFNDITKPVIIECSFGSENLRELLESKIKLKIKKGDGLDEFLNDFIFGDTIVFRKTVNTPKKGFDSESILLKDFEDVEFSMLYNKSDEQLKEIITRNNITIPVDGEGRNSKIEQIKYIKEFCKTNSKSIVEKYVTDDNKISSLFPEVELFKSDYGLEADTKFRTTSVSEIQDYFNRETSTDEKRLKLIEKEIEAEMQVEANLIKGYMNEYVPSLNSVEIKPNINWKDAIKSVDVNFQFEGDAKPIPMSHKGTGYRRLFMVARFRFLAEKNKGKNIVYLIEEPETFLHPSAQDDLLNALRDLSSDNQVIVTTHSPIFAGATDTKSLILCLRTSQSIYEYTAVGGEREFSLKIAKELGIKPSYNLRDHHEKIVFVESTNDAKFYDIICIKFLNNKLLNNDKILVLPFGGGKDIESFLNIDYFDTSGRDLFLIIDSDKQENNHDKQKKRAIDFETSKERGESYVINRSCIENYYHPRAFEREHNLEENSFDFIKAEENARKVIKKYILDNSLEDKNIKEKNNFKVFRGMKKEEWKEVIEDDLMNFLKKIVQEIEEQI
jgi:putative ATP-dependent endonuclease of the OLD family